MKPNVPHIIVNGEKYERVDQDFHIVAIFRNGNREIKISGSTFFSTWWIELLGGDITIWRDEINENITIDPKRIPTILTAEQDAAMDKLLTEVLLTIERR